jgi:hypothetical protein
LYLFDSCKGYLAAIGSCENTKSISKLEVGGLQSSNDFVGFFPKHWNMSAILIFVVIFLIITNRGGSSVVWYTSYSGDGVRLVLVVAIVRVRI